MLGIGYLFLRRWGAAVATIITSAILILILASFSQPGIVMRTIVTAWWVITIVHGARLARRTADATGSVKGQRAIAITAVALLAVVTGGMAALTQRQVAKAVAAHTAGDCDEAITALADIDKWEKITDPTVTARTRGDATACGLVVEAEHTDDPAQAAQLLAQYLSSGTARWVGASGKRDDLLLIVATTGLTAAEAGDAGQLATAFDALGEVGADRADDVEALVDGYLAKLPGLDPCVARANLDWLHDHGGATGGGNGPAARASTGADAIATPLLLACGDKLLGTDPHQARAAYQSVVDRYPGDPRLDAANAGINNADTAIELQVVRTKVAGAAPAYCTSPAPYRAAPPWSGGGPHLMLALGDPAFVDDVPGEWKAPDAATASLIVCVSGPTDGHQVESCGGYYGAGFSDYTVSLRATEYAVKVFELKSGALVVDTTVDLRATSGCPQTIDYTCYGYTLCPPPPTVRASFDANSVRSAVQSWVFH